MHRTERTGASPQSSLKFIFPRVRSIWSAFRSAGEGISCRTRSTSRIANRFPPPAEEVRRRNTSKRTLETRRTRGFERVTNQGTPYNCSSFFSFFFPPRILLYRSYSIIHICTAATSLVHTCHDNAVLCTQSLRVGTSHVEVVPRLR